MTKNMIFGVIGIAFGLIILEVSNDFHINSDKYVGFKKKKYQRRGYILLLIGLIIVLVSCVIFSSDSAA